MPLTPFHFGPGALLHAAAPKQVSFLAFCASNVLIDLESLYNLINQRSPVHAFLHTYLGATLASAVVILLFIGCRWFAVRYWLPDLFRWRELGTRQIAIGAALGAYSHVVLDSVMHHDIQPLWPVESGNAILGLVSLSTLHLVCAAAGAIGILVVVLRWLLAGDEEAR